MGKPAHSTEWKTFAAYLSVWQTFLSCNGCRARAPPLSTLSKDFLEDLLWLPSSSTLPHPIPFASFFVVGVFMLLSRARHQAECWRHGHDGPFGHSWLCAGARMPMEWLRKEEAFPQWKWRGHMEALAENF